MTVITRHVPWTSQPTGRRALDYQCLLPLGTPLVVVVGGSLENLVSTKALTIVGSNTIESLRPGLAHANNNTGEIGANIPATGAADYVDFWYGSATWDASKEGFYVVGDYTGSAGTGVFVKHTQSSNCAGFFGGTQLIKSTTPFVSGSTGIFVFVKRSGLGSLYLNGELIAAGTMSSPGQSNWSAGNLGLNQGATFRTPAKTLLAGRLGNVAWSANQARSFSANPWQIFASQSRRLVFALGGAPAPIPQTRATSLSAIIREAQATAAAAGLAVQASASASTSLGAAIRVARLAAADVSLAVQQADAASSLVQLAVSAGAQQSSGASAVVQATQQAAANLVLAVQQAKTVAAAVSLQVQADELKSADVSLMVQASAVVTASAQTAVQAVQSGAAGLGAVVQAVQQVAINLTLAVQQAKSASTALSMQVKDGVAQGADVSFMVQSGAQVAASIQAAIELSRMASASVQAAVARLAGAAVGVSAAISLSRVLGAALSAQINTARSASVGASLFVFGGIVFYPDPSDVRQGVTYGPTGVEFVGTSVGAGSALTPEQAAQLAALAALLPKVKQDTSLIPALL